MSKIEKLEIKNVKELFSVLEKNKSFKSIELNKIQCGQVYEFVTAQQSKIEELEKDSRNYGFFKYWLVKKYRSLREFVELSNDTIRIHKQQDENWQTIRISEKRQELAKCYMSDIKSLFKFHALTDLEDS